MQVLGSIMEDVRSNKALLDLVIFEIQRYSEVVDGKCIVDSKSFRKILKRLRHYLKETENISRGGGAVLVFNHEDSTAITIYRKNSHKRY